MATAPTTPEVSPTTGPILEDVPEVDLTDWDEVVELVTEQVRELGTAILDQVPLILLALSITGFVLADASDAEIREVATTKAVRVGATVSAEIDLVGRLRVDRFPSPSSAGASENEYEARVKLERPIAGVVAGMRAKVHLPSSASERTAAGAESTSLGGSNR